MQPVRIQGAASRGGAAVLLASLGLLLLLLISLFWVEQLVLWQALALVLVGLGIFAGWAKLAEPQFYLQYDMQGVRYLHRHGSWILPWHAFLYTGVPQYNGQALGYLGFKVTDYDSFLQQLPLRLAVRIMTEQRALYIEAVRQGCTSGQCATELLTEHGQFDTATQRYTGIKAAFASRMAQLTAQTGFGLFVPVSLTPEQTQQLCLQINQARLQLIQNTVT